METLFVTLTRAVEGSALVALGASFAWGVLSILLSPCHLASIPLIVQKGRFRRQLTLKIGSCQDHALGDACIAELRRHGVDTSAIRREAGRLGLYFLSPPAMLRPSQVIYDRAGSAFAQASAEAYHWSDLLRGARWLHVSGITPALGERASQALDAAISAAETLGIDVSFDCNFRPTLWRGRK